MLFVKSAAKVNGFHTCASAVEKFSIQLLPFKEVLHQHMVKPFMNIGLHKVNSVLAAPYFEVVREGGHLLYVVRTYVSRINLHLFTTFHVSESVWAIFKSKINFHALIHHVEKNHFVLVVPQVLQRGKHFTGLLGVVHHITENDNK